MSGERFTLAYEGMVENGHRGWITALACPQTNDASIRLLSASRDKTICSWVPSDDADREAEPLIPSRRLEGHGDFVEDIALSNNAEFALSASWDKSLRLWNVKTGDCVTKFFGHTKDVLSCAFSPDNRQIVSGGRDAKLKLWNVKGDCMFTTQDKDSHTDWVSCVRFSPVATTPLIVSGGWDNMVKVWSLSGFKCLSKLAGHTGHVNTVTVSPDGSLCASAGKDKITKLWDLNRGEHLYELEAGSNVNQIAFSPNRYWLCAATDAKIIVWDLETKEVVAELAPTIEKGPMPSCTSIAWSADGSTLYSGYSDNAIRTWAVKEQ